MSWPQPLPILEKLGQQIVAKSKGAVTSYEVMYGELNLKGPAGRIVQALTYLRDNKDCQFQVLIDVCGADYPERPLRFDVVYHLLSMTKNLRVRINVQTDDFELCLHRGAAYICGEETGLWRASRGARASRG